MKPIRLCKGKKKTLQSGEGQEIEEDGPTEKATLQSRGPGCAAEPHPVDVWGCAVKGRKRTDSIQSPN